MPLPIRLLGLFAFLTPLSAVAQVAPPAGGGVDAPAPLVVMNLAAHPDDEDGATLAYYRYAKDAVAHSVLYTRGEGGQNEAGPDLYERLGAIRTAETERAARILGTQVHYLNFYDFGFSKHAAETFREWSRPRRGFWDTDAPPVSEAAGRDAVTARLVYLIRALKPDVLFTNHDTTTAWPRAQHGHHQVVGISTWEAFEKAADPAYHPEQLAEEGVDLWQPSRLFVRQYRPDGTHDVAVPVSDPCPTGRAFQAAPGCSDLAVLAAAQHVSQGFDKFADRFRRDTTYFELYRSAPGVPPLPAGATDLATGLAREAPPALSLPYLVASGRVAEAPEGAFEVSAPVAVPGQRVTVSWPDGFGPEDGRLRLSTPATATAGLADGALTVLLPPDAPFSLPHARYQYDRADAGPPVLYLVEDADGRPVYGGRLPLEIAPPVVAEGGQAPLRLAPGPNPLPLSARVYDPAADSVTVRARFLSLQTVGPDGAVRRPEASELSGRYRSLALLADARDEVRRAASAGDTLDLTLTLDVPADVPPGVYPIRVEATTGDAPAYTYDVNGHVLPDVQVAEGLRVGFVRSYDRVTEDALRAMGAEVVVLDSTALATGAFDGLDTIVLDIRAYLVRPDLRAHNDRLLDWVRAGGHLVVGYHKLFEWNAGQDTGGFFDTLVEVPDEGWAPYPLRLGRDRVTMEDAPVEVLAPGHAAFNAPHAITAADWDGWVQERGLYFPSDYDDRYRELVTVGDAGETPLQGGLLLAEVGEGTYLYSPLVFYRQLEALNPGAWRLFANLVSLPLVQEGEAGG